MDAGQGASGPAANLDYRVAHGVDRAGSGGGGVGRTAPSFVLVRNAGTGEADGVYKPASRRWLDHDVYANRYGDCIISREAHQSPKTGEVKHGFVLGKDGRPLYGAKTERLAVPAKGWKVLRGLEPAPEVLIFPTWSDACQHGAWYFGQEAENAARGGHWKVVLMMADRAFDCHTNARPKGRGDIRDGGSEWSEQLCELLGTRAEALLHLGEYRRALVDACSAVHFVAAFEWSKARTRGITACLNLGVEEDQAKLLMEEMCRRNDREFPGVKALEPLIDSMLERAKSQSLQKMDIKDDEVPDDGRIFFRVCDPEDCKLYSRADFAGKVLGGRGFGDVVRGDQVLKQGTWLELHVSEEFDQASGHRRAYVPIFTEGPEDDREEILERLAPREYPRPSRWEELRVPLKYHGLKPPGEQKVPLEYGRWREEEPRNQKPWPYIYKHGLAVATMLRGAGERVIDSFVRFHWATGWNHVFLLFDDPKDPGISHAEALEAFVREKKVEGVGLSVVRMDAEWWTKARETSRFYQRREKNDRYERVCKLQDKYGDVESRQMIAMDQAIMEAWKMGIDWFASLDIDECIYVPKMMENSSRRFFGSKERSVEAVRLWNFEAVPEQMECGDWFRECTLFQVNPCHCRGFKPPREYDQLLRQREGRELEPEKHSRETKYWNDIMAQIHVVRQQAARRLKLELPPPVTDTMPSLSGASLPEELKREPIVETFFSFTAYTGGKTVVRLDQHFNPPLPLDMHSYLADNGDMLKEIYQANKSDDAVILHYPNANFTHWKSKYERLGDLSRARESHRAHHRMHLASSKVVLRNSWRDQELFYRTFVMQNEQNEVAYMAEHGLVVRVGGVRDLLEWYDEPHDAPEVLPGQMEWVSPESGLKLGGRR